MIDYLVQCTWMKIDVTEDMLRCKNRLFLIVEAFKDIQFSYNTTISSMCCLNDYCEEKVKLMSDATAMQLKIVKLKELFLLRKNKELTKLIKNSGDIRRRMIQNNIEKCKHNARICEDMMCALRNMKTNLHVKQFHNRRFFGKSEFYPCQLKHLFNNIFNKNINVIE